jgi:hypothetical protein
MAKESGLGWTTCSADNSSGTLKAIVNDVNSIEFGTPRAVQEVTGMDKSAIERILLLADFQATLSGTFNDATDFSHDVFKVLDNQRTLTLVVSGQTLSNEVFFTDYPLSRGDDGSLTWQVPAVLANGTVPTWS